MGNQPGKKNNNKNKKKNKKNAWTKRRILGLTWSAEMRKWMNQFGMNDVFKKLHHTYYRETAIPNFEDECRFKYGVPYVFEAFYYTVDDNLPRPRSMCKDIFFENDCFF